jgi:hypothetical protein
MKEDFINQEIKEKGWSCLPKKVYEDEHKEIEIYAG